MSRPPRLWHATPEPYRFFGRERELNTLTAALHPDGPSLVAFVGPGGQGKTAILQAWLTRILETHLQLDGLFLWSFYRGKDSDLCLRELLAYAEGLPAAPEVSATYCVDHLLPRLRSERWAILLDGTEVVQHEAGAWFGRFLHPELDRMLEELATAPQPGVVVLTTRFPIPTLQRRSHTRLVNLDSLEPESARGLLASLGVQGEQPELDRVATLAGLHAKGVELLGTYITHVGGGKASRFLQQSSLAIEADGDLEATVAGVLGLFQQSLPEEARDIVALATAYRQPPGEDQLLDYLSSQPVQSLLHSNWKRHYTPFASRGQDWLRQQIEFLVQLRLLERVRGTTADSVPGSTDTSGGGDKGYVIDAHPLVRRGFEHARGTEGRRDSALARSGFLRGRPDRRKPATLEEAQSEVELFHAFCEAGLWNEADATIVALDNPKHRFLAPTFERDLLLQYFPQRDARQQPLWAGFGRYRSLAICLEMMGDFAAALRTYPPGDAPLCGDALLALGDLQPLLTRPQVEPIWQPLWQAYRCHALCLAGRTIEAVALARTLIPTDIYEWVHVWECLVRCGELGVLDMRSVLYRPPHQAEHRWAELARLRIRADHERLTGAADPSSVNSRLREAREEYDRAGLPVERTLTRLSQGRLAQGQQRWDEAERIAAEALELARRHSMRIMVVDALEQAAAIAARRGDTRRAEKSREEAMATRGAIGYLGPSRP